MQVWGCLVSCAGFGCLLPLFPTTSSVWKSLTAGTAAPFYRKALSGRWSLPPSLPTKDPVTMTVAVTSSFLYCCGGARGFSHISRGTLNASTVQRPPVWSQATARYQTCAICVSHSVGIISDCSDVYLVLERSSCTRGQHPSYSMGRTSGRMRRRFLVCPIRPGLCFMKSPP